MIRARSFRSWQHRPASVPESFQVMQSETFCEGICTTFNTRPAWDAQSALNHRLRRNARLSVRTKGWCGVDRNRNPILLFTYYKHTTKFPKHQSKSLQANLVINTNMSFICHWVAQRGNLYPADSWAKKPWGYLFVWRRLFFHVLLFPFVKPWKSDMAAAGTRTALIVLSLIRFAVTFCQLIETSDSEVIIWHLMRNPRFSEGAQLQISFSGSFLKWQQ